MRANHTKIFLRSLTATTLKIFPDAIAIILWGSAAKRRWVLRYGDVDILVVVKNNSIIKPSMLSALKKDFKNVDVDPCAITEDDLGRSPIISIGIRGDYKAHGLIHYQLKHESRVVWGNRKILNGIAPITFREALLDIVSHEKKNFIPRLNNEIKTLHPSKFISSNFGYLLVLVRTIYSVRTGKIASKGGALAYLAKEYPDLKNLSGYLFKKYTVGKIEKHISASDIKNLLNEADKIFTRFLHKRSINSKSFSQ